jgi:hypothetical protein
MRGFVILLCIAVSACGRDSDTPAGRSVQEHDLRAEETVVSMESDLLAGPVALAADPEGTVYIADRLERHVLVVAPDGSIRTIGREGSGPGEFAQPRAVGIVGGRVHVLDLATRTVHEFGTDGAYASSRRLEMQGAPLSYAFSPAGHVAYTRFPADTGLVHILDAHGQPIGSIGSRVSSEPMQPETLLQEIQGGRLPGFMRNRALPAYGSDGTLWVFLQSEAVLQRYGKDGSLEHAENVRIPEMDRIRQEFFQWYEGQTALGGVRFLDYVDAIVVVDGQPWLLWKVPMDQSAVVTVHNEQGTVTSVLRITGVEGDAVAPDPTRPPAARRMAVDMARRRLYLVDDQSVTLRAARLPDGVTRD